MHLRLIPVTPRLVERLKAAQIAMFGDPSHGGRLHEEVVQTARGPEHRWVAGEAAPKPKKAGPPKTPEKGKDPNDKRTFELDDLINVHKKAQAIPRHHVYQAALQAWNHDPEARERYKEAMVEDTSAGEGPAHQRLRLWYAKGRLRETMKGLDERAVIEVFEALKAKAKGDTATLDMLALMGPPAAPAAKRETASSPAPAAVPLKAESKHETLPTDPKPGDKVRVEWGNTDGGMSRQKREGIYVGPQRQRYNGPASPNQHTVIVDGQPWSTPSATMKPTITKIGGSAPPLVGRGVAALKFATQAHGPVYGQVADGLLEQLEHGGKIGVDEIKFLQSAGPAKLWELIKHLNDKHGPAAWNEHRHTLGDFVRAQAPHAAHAPVNTDEPTHGGHLHAEMRTDKIGRTQTRWVGQPEAPAAHQEPAAPKPAPTPKANATKAAGGQAEVKKKPASDWPTEHPGRNDVDAVQKWLTAAPPGARLQIGDVALEKRDVDLPQVGGIWRLSGLRDVISSEALAIQLGPELAPDDEGNAREWERYFRKPTPKQLEGKITAAAPGEDHIHIDDPVIQTEIPSAYVGRFEAAVERLQKRAARLGLQPLTFEKTGTSAQTVVVGQPPDIITRIVPTTLFTVVMPDMALPGGWKFIGAVEHGENGNKVHFRHKPDSLDTKAYRLHESTCDHCQTNRRRKLTVVLQNRDGETKRVGSDCMKDYIGHDIPLTGWSSIQDQMQAELYGEIDEAWSEGAVKNATGATTEDYMATVARVIREDGRYISRRGADDGETPTADAAWSAITNRKGDPANAGAGKRALAEEDLAAAARVIAWARAIPPDTDDDFLHNVRVALAGPAIIRSDAGFAAAAFAAMRRDNAKRGIVEPGTGRRVGNVGDKIGIGKGYAIPPIVGTVIHRSDHRSDFGWSSLVKVKGDDGNVYTTFASNPNYTNMGQHDPYFLTSYGLLPKRTSSGPAEGTPDAGDRVRIHGGSIKKHETFRGEPQNVLTRTKFERIGIPDISEAKLPTKREKALDGRGVEVEVENPWREHEIAFMDHASAEAQRQGHMPGDDDFAHAFAHELKAAKARWPQDFGAHHYVDEWNDDGLFWPRTHNDRITDTPRTEIGLLNHLRAQQRRAREYGQDWHWPDADTYQAMLDETLKRGREYPSQHEITKALAPEVGPPPARNRQTHPFVGTIRIPGLPKIRVETKKGQTRSGVDPDGNAWSVVMPAHYGEFHGTRGVDGDPVDVFVGPDVHAPYAYVFHMSKLGEGGYDEDKVCVGHSTREDAERCLRDAYDRAGLFHAPPKRLTIAELAHWLADPENRGRMVDAGREMAKAVPVPVLSLTGGPVRVARVQVATEPPAVGQGLAEAIRAGEGPAHQRLRLWYAKGTLREAMKGLDEATVIESVEALKALITHEQLRELGEKRLVEMGPPDEWSGGVALSMSTGEREAMRGLWAKLTKERQDQIRAKWAAQFDESTKALAPEVGPPPVRNRQAHPFVGTIRIPGLPKIRVETKKGETRSGVDPDGNAWSVVMPAHYGEFHGTRGVDGDPVDVFVGPDVHAPYAYVFHMSKLGEGGYDEDKVACGFKTREDAERCLRDAYDRAGLFHAPPKRLTIAELAHWLADPENRGRMVDAGREMAKGGQIANAPGFVLDPATHRWTRSTPQPEKMRTGAVKVDEQAVQSLATKVKAVLPTTASADGFDRKVHVRGAGSLHMGRVQMTGADGVLRSVTAHLHHGPESANPASIRGALRVAHQGDGTASTEHELHITVPQSPSGGHDAAAFESRLHSVIHHELAHLSDPQVHQPGRGDAHLGDGDTDKAKYVNDPREITARVAQVARELNRRPSVRTAKTTDLNAFMSGSSPTWRAVEEHLTPENRRRFLKMAANVYQNHRDGTSGPDLVMKAVPVLSLTGAPPRVARVQVATAAPAAGQGLAEAIREGEDIGDGGQGQGAPVTPACETCNVPMNIYRGPPWASIYGCPVCHAKTEIPNPNYRRPGSDDAPAQAPEVCKDANCTDPAHGHEPEAVKARPESAKSLPAHLEID